MMHSTAAWKDAYHEAQDPLGTMRGFAKSHVLLASRSCRPERNFIDGSTSAQKLAGASPAGLAANRLPFRVLDR